MPDSLVTLELTPAQLAVLQPLAAKQTKSRRGLLLVSVSPPHWKTPTWRLQAMFLDWDKATKVLKLIKE